MKQLTTLIVVVMSIALSASASLAASPPSSTNYLSGYGPHSASGWRWPQASTLPLREISYYPKDYAWSDFWRHWPQAKLEMDADLDRIEALGANTVRIFLQPDVFGFPIPNRITSYFEEALALIAAHGLKAHVNLFDCWQCWHDVSDSQTWLRLLVQPHRDDARIAIWELRNEVGLDQPAIRAWVQAVFPYLKAQAGSTPCTVSVSNVEWLDDVKDLTGSTPPDIYSLHWSPDVVSWTRPFPAVIDRARQLIGTAPLLIGEFGLSTYAYSDISQAHLYTDVFYYAHQKGIADLGAWTLNDFSPGAIGCDGPITETEELFFGLYRTDGTPKPAASILRDAFHGNPPSRLSPSRMHNTSFEDLNRYSLHLDNWWPWDESWSWQHWETQDCTLAHSGRCSVRLSPSVPMAVGLYNVPALPVEYGELFNLEGYVQTRNLQGCAELVLSWFEQADPLGDTRWITNTESQCITDPNLTQWTRISMQNVRPPAGAKYVEVFAKMHSTGSASTVWFDDVTTLTEHGYLPLGLKTAQ